VKHKLHFSFYIFLALQLAMVAGCASAHRNNIQPSDVKTAMAFNQLHHINQKEIAMSQMALDKAQSEDVKHAARQMIQDHQALDNRLQESARNQNIDLLTFTPATHEKATMDQMKKLSGSQFDQAFLENMRGSHMEAEQTLSQLDRESDNQMVRTLVSEAMPKIRAHRDASIQGQRGIASDPSMDAPTMSEPSLDEPSLDSIDSSEEDSERDM
jgi:putative membrane protein